MSNDITRNDILQAYPLRKMIAESGCKLVKDGSRMKCCCPFHNEKTPSLVYYPDQDSFHCYGCGKSGTAIDWEAHMNHGGNTRAAYRELAERVKQETTQRQQAAKSPALAPKQQGKKEVEETYEYVDASGKVRFCVDRLKDENGKKSFHQYHIQAGRKVYKMDGVERILYRLPQVMNELLVMLCEGEKCVHALEECGYTATTNPGGSKSWKSGYAQYLAGKEVVVFPDNDDPGEAWLESVKESLASNVKSMRVIRMPETHNDIADMLDADGVVQTTSWISNQFKETAAIYRGVELPLLSSAELESRYADFIGLGDFSSVNLGRFVASFGEYVRPLYPGDLVTIMADTGVGKTAIARNIARSLRPQPCVFFEIELTDVLMAERDIAMVHDMSAARVEFLSRTQKKRFDMSAMDHVYTCVESKVTPEFIEQVVNKSELMIGQRPVAVFVDYIGLVKGGFGKRYERMSAIAEELKVVAKATQTVLFITSQVHRDTAGEIGLHDAKDSGSIENSSALVLGAWRPTRELLRIKVLKQTKGMAGDTIDCEYIGAHSIIKEWKGDLPQGA